ncbi:hypothetical protein [uncultured Aquimarina sp.]|uniref:hypothetical protein n=1 Tax=uncultured Aquimarina sp. TaxID=575652 RepID=UPI00261F8C61|nr:hypothetical protein [uncultured Aquimarina sp.]
MKKDILKNIRKIVLTKKEKQTIVGGYDGPFTGNCSFICCGGSQNQLNRISNPCDSRPLYVYRPNPSLHCVSTC